MSEHNEQARLFSLLARHEELKWVHAIPNGGLRNKRTAANMKQEGVKAGVWDIFIPIPKQGKHGMYLEMKYGFNRLTSAQVEFGRAMEALGYECKVAYSAETAYEFILSYLEMIIQ